MDGLPVETECLAESLDRLSGAVVAHGVRELWTFVFGHRGVLQLSVAADTTEGRTLRRREIEDLFLDVGAGSDQVPRRYAGEFDELANHVRLVGISGADRDRRFFSFEAALSVFETKAARNGLRREPDLRVEGRHQPLP